jgi:uncharacterized peroxidase-related enzyme
MRPRVLDTYRPSLKHRILLWAMKRLLGPSAVDAGRAAYYRPELFPRPFYLLQQLVMHGPSQWSAAERELFAAVTSAHNRCRFCTVAHSSIAAAGLKRPEWVREAIAGRRPEAPRLSAVLGLMEKLTQQPWNLTRADIDSLRECGVSDRAIEEAAMVCVVFNIGNRLADALDVEVLSPAAIRRATPLVQRFGYALYAL